MDAGTQDITISATTLTLSGSNLNNSIVITGVDDEFYEGVESVDLMITSSDRAVMPSILTVSIDIEDNECEWLKVRVLACICACVHTHVSLQGT